MAAERHLEAVRDVRRDRTIPSRGSEATVAAWQGIHAAFETAINNPAVDAAERRYMRELAEVSGLSVAACRLARFCEGVS
ncbi:MAG TPA: hypothetical protein VHF88_07660 [Thermoleophilaceae bacterium]|nr:hypothetical protein [Thermoleophilaceae bacterium]